MSTIKRAGVVLALLILAGLLLIPWIHWANQPVWPLRLQILDKSVPDRSFREHAALIWSLNHLKILHPQGRAWDKERDYRGYTPYEPATRKPGEGLPLRAEDLHGRHLLFLADTYGVYSQDEAEARHEKAPDYSRRIFGGLDAGEVTLIEQFLASGQALIAEFNTFASPTQKPERIRLQQLLGLRWTEWSGRFFSELSHPIEIPAWARRNWKKQTGQEWAFQGPGLLFVHENGRVAVLQEKQEIHPEGLRIFRTSSHPFMKGFGDGIPFHYWFDIVQPAVGSQVLAEYRLDLTDRGAQILNREGIPHHFPALILREQPSLRLYLAGDASDNALDLGNFRWSGRQTWFWYWPWDNPTPEQVDFFWRGYLPLMRHVFTYLSKHYQGTPGFQPHAAPRFLSARSH